MMMVVVVVMVVVEEKIEKIMVFVFSCGGKMIIEMSKIMVIMNMIIYNAIT